jgi:hypothetical protein
MKCEYCNKNWPLPMLRFIPAGSVKGIIGMKRNKAQCQECAAVKKTISLDNTSKHPLTEDQAAQDAIAYSGREPGEDDDLEEYPF